jgi:ppGpp synthetase/RelA/SpoT-type nucleotidyltranferase
MSSTGHSSSCDEKVRTCVKNVLGKYKRIEIQQLYGKLVELTRKECEVLLKNIDGKNNEKGIKGVVQGRTKKCDSLEEKLDGLAQVSEFRDWVSGESLKKKLGDLEQDSKFRDCASEDLFKKLVDLLHDSEFGSWAPGDSLKKKLGVLAQDSKFRDWVKDDSLKKRMDDLAKDSNFGDCVSEEDHIFKYREMGDLAGVRIGLYFPDDILKVVKKIKEPSSPFKEVHLFGTVTGGRDVTKVKNLDIDKHLDGPWLDGNNGPWEHYGYKSWQMVVEWKNSLPEGLNSLRVEIQVGTVVTQAWAEVQHNIIYKEPANIRATPSVKRISDAINGLAITTDIMLKELERSLEEAKKEAWIEKTEAWIEKTEAWNADTEAWIEKTEAWNADTEAWNADTEAWNAKTEAWNANTEAWNAKTEAWNAEREALNADTEAWNAKTEAWNEKKEAWNAERKALNADTEAWNEKTEALNAKREALNAKIEAWNEKKEAWNAMKEAEDARK